MFIVHLRLIILVLFLLTRGIYHLCFVSRFPARRSDVLAIKTGAFRPVGVSTHKVLCHWPALRGWSTLLVYAFEALYLLSSFTVFLILQSTTQDLKIRSMASQIGAAASFPRMLEPQWTRNQELQQMEAVQICLPICSDILDRILLVCRFCD